jgi:hypothetical protein
MDIAALNEIATEVKRIARSGTAPQQTLGFGSGPKRLRHVYCDHKHGGLWYFLDEQSNPIAIEHKSLTGYVRHLEFKAALHQGEKVFTLNCTIEADRFYVLVSESTAHFSKALLSAIAQLTIAKLRQPLTVVPQIVILGEEVLSCQVYQGDRQVFAHYGETTDWRGLSRAAVNAVKLANQEESLQTFQA